MTKVQEKTITRVMTNIPVSKGFHPSNSLTKSLVYNSLNNLTEESLTDASSSKEGHRKLLKNDNSASENLTQKLNFNTKQSVDNKLKRAILLKTTLNQNNFSSTVNRFINNSPFFVETRKTLGKMHAERAFIQNQIIKEKRTTLTRDYRYDGLILNLCEVKK